MKVDMYFKFNLDVEDIDNIEDFGNDLSIFLEEFMNGEQSVDVRYIGHLKISS